MFIYPNPELIFLSKFLAQLTFYSTFSASVIRETNNYLMIVVHTQDLLLYEFRNHLYIHLIYQKVYK